MVVQRYPFLHFYISHSHLCKLTFCVQNTTTFSNHGITHVFHGKFTTDCGLVTFLLTGVDTDWGVASSDLLPYPPSSFRFQT